MDANTLKNFRHELSELLGKYDVILGVRMSTWDGFEEHNFVVIDGDSNCTILSEDSLYLDASDVRIEAYDDCRPIINTQAYFDHMTDLIKKFEKLLPVRVYGFTNHRVSFQWILPEGGYSNESCVIPYSVFEQMCNK
jgi:2,4-dienoyl-CoA reductase-like NADH-dependent reductase (Old Yellow Enzyme family)